MEYLTENSFIHPALYFEMPVPAQREIILAQSVRTRYVQNTARTEMTQADNIATYHIGRDGREILIRESVDSIASRELLAQLMLNEARHGNPDPKKFLRKIRDAKSTS